MSKIVNPVIIFDFDCFENWPVDLLLTTMNFSYEILVGSHGSFNCSYICRSNLSDALALA